MSFRKRVLPFLLIIGFVFAGVLGVSSTKAFAMNSKGSSQVAFHTDANTYSKNATTIDVIGRNDHSEAISIELYKKGDSKFYKRIDLYKSGAYKVSFSLKGLKAGQYDVWVNGGWADRSYRAVLQHYLTVQR
ncbi:hypothetical protein [Paenilisteria weihenstephanensis]|uniref:Uncharacterized protein n=2 Tax=Listeria weihenstephanensis TaxID=1006155 RepID=A0A1S7FUM6_9LIST|nr:hypothetical protein [Listeria weihenstephanensis]AQY51156.1 hypothetical protein UE46_08915 [Listeria weihenstephanensis]